MTLLPEKIEATTTLEEIIQGATVHFQVQLQTDRTRRALDCTPFVSAQLRGAGVPLPDADPCAALPVWSKDLDSSIVAAGLLGLLDITLTGTETTQLNAGEEQTLELEIVTSGTTAATTIIELFPVRIAGVKFRTE